MMLPVVARLQMSRARGGRSLRLWLPLFAIWMLLLPFAVVTLPVVAVALWLLGRNPFELFAAVWRFLASLPGLHVEVRSAGAHLRVHIR